MLVEVPAMIVRAACGGPLVLPLGCTMRYAEWRGTLRGLDEDYRGPIAVVISNATSGPDDVEALRQASGLSDREVSGYVDYVHRWKYRLFGFTSITGVVRVADIDDDRLEELCQDSFNLYADSGVFITTAGYGETRVSHKRPGLAPTFDKICVGCLDGEHKPNGPGGIQGFRSAHTGIQTVRVQKEWITG